MKRKRTNPAPMIIGCLTSIIVILLLARILCSIPYQFEVNNKNNPYEEQESVNIAIALSTLAYGCEHAENKFGTVNDLLDNNKMGIITTNYGLRRTDLTDASTAAYDADAYVRKYSGDFRFVADMTNESNGFYGAAFCDDENKVIWVSYSGSIDFDDVIACVALVVRPGLSRQERDAFEFMNTVCNLDEVRNQDYSVLLTGHSLGGALATMISCHSGCEAITINGANGLALDKYNGICGGHADTSRITNYMTSNLNGRTSFMDIVQSFMYLGSYTDMNYHVYPENGKNTEPHCTFSFIVEKNGEFVLPDEQ